MEPTTSSQPQHHEPLPVDSAIFPSLNEIEREEYERGIRKARNVLFFVGVLMFVVDSVMLAAQWNATTSLEATITIVLDVIFLAAFIGLGLWSKRKPYAALLTGLILFCAIQLLAMIGDPANIYRGVILKVVVVVALVSGIKKARRLQELTRLSNPE